MRKPEKWEILGRKLTKSGAAARMKLVDKAIEEEIKEHHGNINLERVRARVTHMMKSNRLH